jgi:hypothetical protein
LNQKITNLVNLVFKLNFKLLDLFSLFTLSSLNFLNAALNLVLENHGIIHSVASSSQHSVAPPAGKTRVFQIAVRCLPLRQRTSTAQAPLTASANASSHQTMRGT